MTILKKLLILSFLFFLTFETVISQVSKSTESKSQKAGYKYPNIVKINSLALAFSNTSLIYERGIMPRLSASIGVGYKYRGAVPKLLSVNKSVIQADIDDIKGFSITPDVKYYLRSCDPSYLEGFYAGLYLRYTHYNSGVNFGYIPENKPPQLYKSDIFLNEYGVGIQLGYQLIIKERFSVDFLFFGPRFSSYHLGYKFNQTPSPEFFEDLSDYINEVVDRFGIDYEVDIKNEGNSKASTSFSFANTRFGISLGYSF